MEIKTWNVIFNRKQQIQHNECWHCQLQLLSILVSSPDCRLVTLLQSTGNLCYCRTEVEIRASMISKKNLRLWLITPQFTTSPQSIITEKYGCCLWWQVLLSGDIRVDAIPTIKNQHWSPLPYLFLLCSSTHKQKQKLYQPCCLVTTNCFVLAFLLQCLQHFFKHFATMKY